MVRGDSRKLPTGISAATTRTSSNLVANKQLSATANRSAVGSKRD